MSESEKATMRPGDSTLFDRSIETLSAHFHYWGRIEAPPMDSPLYSELGYGVALDPEILAIAARTGPNQPAPNNLFAAVQHLLLRGADHPLRAHYPHLSGRAKCTGLRSRIHTGGRCSGFPRITRAKKRNERSTSGKSAPARERGSARRGRPPAAPATRPRDPSQDRHPVRALGRGPLTC